MPEQQHQALVPLDRIENSILILRGERVILDEVLATLYAVTTKRLNEQVRRNIARFPSDFMFQLSQEEYERLRSQSATLKSGRGKHRKYLPFVFTEQGIAMLSSVLGSERAILVNIEIMRAFVRLRRWMVTHADLAQKLAAMESKYDIQFRAVFQAIRSLMVPPVKEKKEIGFKVKEKASAYSIRKRKASHA